MDTINSQLNSVWVFHGAKGRFASGVFINKDDAANWIMKHKLTGILTLYPINYGVYDWAIENELFAPKKEQEIQPLFIQGFTTASQEHYHYEDGKEN